MRAVENPSADKFGPPPEQAARDGRRLRVRTKALDALGPAALVIGLTALRIFARSRRGWVGAAAGLLAGVGYVAMYIVRRRQRDAQGDAPDPYSPPTNITR